MFAVCGMITAFICEGCLCRMKWTGGEKGTYWGGPGFFFVKVKDPVPLGHSGTGVDDLIV